MRNMDAFTTNMGTANYADKYYQTFATTKNIVKSVLYVAVTVISDAFIVSLAFATWPSTVILTRVQMYRSFIVWGRNYFVAVIPFLLFLADIGKYSFFSRSQG